MPGNLFTFFRRTIELLFSAFLFYSGLLFLYLKLPRNRRKIPILLYHEIGNADSCLYDGIYVRPEYFARQLEYLVKHYHTIFMDTLVKGLKGKVRLPDLPVLISFDGGYKGLYKYAFPLLKKYNTPAVIYLITGAMDGKLPWERSLYYSLSMTSKTELTISGKTFKKVFSLDSSSERRRVYNEIREIINIYPPETRERALDKVVEDLEVSRDGICPALFLNWEEIKELSASGLIEIESHTINHYRLTRIPEEEAKKEIEESKQRIEQELSQPVAHFCYPDGLFSDKIKQMVKTAGYETGLAVSSHDGTKGLNTTHEDLYELKRIYISNQPFCCVFAAQVAGILDTIGGIAKRFLGKRS